MEIGIDSFAKKTQTNEAGGIGDNARAMNELIERIVHADKVGLDIFGIGEHHREEFLDSAAHNILSAAAAKTENIRLTSAVAVISAMDPVRLFQNYATLDLISNGRAEIFEGEDDLYVWTAHEHQREKLACVLVDEAQFLTPKQVLQLTLIVDKLKIPVLCYGLRTDFRGEPFPGSMYLMAWADELVELKTICKSGKKATFNARLDEDGNRVTEGDQVSIGLNYEAQARDIFELEKVSPINYEIPEAN
ncbi:LLM class flavin-dependent oxidoreductase [Candidatus Actinomarina]|nr:LLM class flavin-dependent oxidoreductase [Candidatus Actinomarina sp.]